MDAKPRLVYILMILWIIIAILFAGNLIEATTDYLDYREETDQHPSYSWHDLDMHQYFYFIMYALLFTVIIFVSCLLIYGMFFDKRWSWLIGTIFASFLIMFVFHGLYSFGSAIIGDYLDYYFEIFRFITNLLMIFIVPILLFILMRPEVKSHFEKPNNFNRN